MRDLVQDARGFGWRLYLHVSLLGKNGRSLNAGLDHGLGDLQSVIHHVDTGFFGETYYHKGLRVIIRALQDDFTVSKIDNLQ